MYELTLTEEQAQIVSRACEFYARMRMGQFGEVTWNLLSIHSYADDYCMRKEEADRLLYEARKQIYPDLYGVGHSYGYGKFADADRAFDIYSALHEAMGKGGKFPPFGFDLPKCVKIEDE